MKQVHGWAMPDHEAHLGPWMDQNPQLIHGRQAYQGKKQLAALAFCKQRRTAIDVGGHVGLWSFNLMHDFQNVHAFEPVAEHRECFKVNVLNQLPSHGSVVLYDMALGAIEGSVSIATEKGSSGNSTVAGSGDIRMIRLDSLDFQDVDFMKIDCEGYEENVLIGGVETILRCKPVIIVEQKRDMSGRYGFKPQGAVTFLQNLGYKLAKEISGDFIMVPG
jgi:FkbM family methyltransferase